MGLSFRKSFGSGPFRINLSKCGVSCSVGVKGARVNFGPRRTYINLSSYGISYQHKLSAPPSSIPEPNHQLIPAAFGESNSIASAQIGQLTDMDSKDFIAELTKKSAQISRLVFLGVFLYF